MRKTRILAIVPYEGLREVLLAEAVKRDDIDMDIFFGDLNDGVAIAKAREKNGYDVILSRGGTAGLIKNEVKLPVVDIIPTIYDLLRFVRMADNMPGPFAIVGFSNVTLVAKKLFDIINRKINIFTLEHSTDAEQVIQRLAKEGYSLIIGDAIATNTAKRHHMNSILIASGEESVHSALTEAINIHKLINHTTLNNLFFQDILEESNLSVVIFNNQNEMLYSSLSDDQLEFQRVFRALPAYIPATLENDNFRVVRHTKGYIFEIVGRVIKRNDQEFIAYYIRRFLDMPKLKHGVIKYYHMLDATLEETSMPIDNIGKMAAVIEKSKVVGRTSSPVCVTGGVGTPFQTVMYAIYHESALRLNSLVSIDCALIDAKSFHWLLESDNSPLCETNLTICFENFHLLETSLQMKYINFANHTDLHKRNRVIYGLKRMNIVSPSAEEFFNAAEFFHISLPSLAERTQDIPYLASLYLSSANVELGKQSIGIHEDALAHMIAYSWPGNNEQLHRVVRSCLMMTASGMIPLESVQKSLAEEEKLFSIEQDFAYDISGTLDEINTRIAMAVLKEEKMNRTKTAQRLNISRSTLWRMLQSRE